MKKFFLFLLVTLGVTVNVFSNNYESFKMKPLGLNNLKVKVSLKTVFLSKDKSTISVVQITQEQILKESKNSAVLYNTVRYDTIKNYFVSKEIRKFVNDSNVITLLNTKVIQLPDSVFPRWTHIFGKDTVLRRSIKISNNQLILISESKVVNPVGRNLINKTLIILLIVLIFNLFSLSEKLESEWVLLGVGVMISTFMFIFRDINFPVFDTIFISSSLTLVTIIFLVIRISIKRKNKKKIHPIKMGLR